MKQRGEGDYSPSHHSDCRQLPYFIYFTGLQCKPPSHEPDVSEFSGGANGPPQQLCPPPLIMPPPPCCSRSGMSSGLDCHHWRYSSACSCVILPSLTMFSSRLCRASSSISCWAC